MFTDGCSVMHGIRAGVQKKLKKVMPNLVDVGSDTCHIVNTAASKFCSAFEGELEALLDNLHVDLSETTLRAVYDNIANSCDVKVLTQKRRFEHRWLAQLPLVKQLADECDILTILYSAYAEDKSRSAKLVKDIYERLEVTEEGKSMINHAVA